MEYSERERTEKYKSANKSLPKDAQIIMSMLKQSQINDYDPHVINQLLEFTYRYVSVLLEDAKVYANHAKKKCVDTEDVKLAVMMQLERSFQPPPPREILLDLTRQRNAVPLPQVRLSCGLRLPPERHCLLAANYKLKASEVPKRMTKAPGGSAKKRNPSAKSQNSKSPKVNPAPKVVFKVNGKGGKTPNKAANKSNGVATVPKSEPVFAIPNSISNSFTNDFSDNAMAVDSEPTPSAPVFQHKEFFENSD